MSDRLPTLTARELIAILEKLGFQERRLTATSHRRFDHPDGRITVIPVHRGRDVGRGLMRKILRDIEMSPDEFKKLL